jgi:hypothetical protein
MFNKYRIILTCVLSLTALCAAAAAAMAARPVSPVTNLHLVSGDVNKVKLAWNAPKHGSTPDATIDDYIIRRNGHKIANLQGFNGMVDTSYIDGSPSTKKSTYSVVAVDSNGRRSPPESVDVDAPKGAAQEPQSTGKDPEDGIQSSNLCESIIPPDIRGHNQPTPMEKYSCGKGMNSVNDSEPGKILGVANKPRPMHDVFQSVFIQFPVTMGHTFWLLISGLAIWVMQAGTYLGLADLFAGALQTLNGDPSMPALLSLGIAVGLIVLGLRLIREQHRQGFISVGIIVAALTVLTLLLSSPYKWMRYTVDQPLSWNAEITNTLTDLTSGADLNQQFHFTVHPTYSGRKSTSAIRRQENTDWLMFQYLPQVAVNFNDYQWALTHNYPGTRTTFAEKFVQVWGTGSDDDKDEFKNKLKDADKDVSKFFNGNDQMQRVAFVVIAKIGLLFHHILKIVTKLALFACGVLLLFEVFAAAIWLIYAMFGTDSSRWHVERRMVSAGHYLKVPLMMTAWGIVELAAAANIVSELFDSGFLAIAAGLLLWEALAIWVAYKLIKKMWRERKEALEARGAYREQSRSLSRKGLEYGMVAATGAAGAGKYLAAKAAKKKAGEKDEDGNDVPSDKSFDFSSLGNTQPLLAAGPAGGYYSQSGNAGPDGSPNGYGGRRPNSPPSNYGGGHDFDIEGEAVDITPRTSQPAMLPPGRSGNGRPNGDHADGPNEPQNPANPNTGSRRSGPQERAGVYSDEREQPGRPRIGNVDDPIADAEVVDNDPSSRGDDSAFRTPGDNRF